MLEFVLAQVTQTYEQSCDKSNTFMIITIKNIIWRGSNKFEDTVYENNETF